MSKQFEVAAAAAAAAAAEEEYMYRYNMSKQSGAGAGPVAAEAARAPLSVLTITPGANAGAPRTPLRTKVATDGTHTSHGQAANAAAAAAGNLPVVFDYREGPPPPMPPARQRDDEVRDWLRSLRLGVLPREEAAELLGNPLRNGVLLSDLMTVLVGAPPLGRRQGLEDIALHVIDTRFRPPLLVCHVIQLIDPSFLEFNGMQ